MILQGNAPDPAKTAEKLAVAKTINTVPFDGAADIVITAEDSTPRIAASERGAANGVAPLGADAKVPSTYLPSYVDDVVEYANLAAFPGTGETGKIYIAVNSATPADPSLQYRWSGSTYSVISPSPGSTDAVAEGIANQYFTPARALAAAPAETVTTAGALVGGAMAKTTPVDADILGLSDSAASGILKKLSWTNVKATLKSYFDTLYFSVTADVTVNGSGAADTAVSVKAPAGRYAQVLYYVGGAFKWNLYTDPSTDNLVFGNGGGPKLTVTQAGDVKHAGKFGCNGATPQAAVTASADATDLASALTLINQLKATLTANGIMQ